MGIVRALEDRSHALHLPERLHTVPWPGWRPSSEPSNPTRGID